MRHYFPSHDLRILPLRQGSRKYVKSSHPLHYGMYTEVRSGNYVLHYNRKGQVKTIFGAGSAWPHPAEWLKRTVGNHWVYYSTGSYYTGVFDLFGEYYLPCPSYPTNTVFQENPFGLPAVQQAMETASSLPAFFSELLAGPDRGTMPSEVLCFLEQAERQTARHLECEAERLGDILGAPITVLPPDCRHVDYDVMPLILTEGCLYNCDFCRVKTTAFFSERSRADIERQLFELKGFFGADLVNYNAVFLGQHDALAAQPTTILFAAQKAFDILEIADSYIKDPRLFIFGSVDSLLDKDEDFFQGLNQLPWQVHINVGLESFDDQTLARLRKPLSPEKIRQAYVRIMELNRRLIKVEISANFVLGEDLPDTHLAALGQLLADRTIPFTSRTTVYLSPLLGSSSASSLLEQFRHIKRKSRLETFLYLIQRL